jgi:hypothetical protein
MNLQFEVLPRVFAEQALWGASQGPFSFVISKEHDEDFFIASAKHAGMRPFQGQRWDLGMFPSFKKAKKACDRWYKLRIS